MNKVIGNIRLADLEKFRLVSEREGIKLAADWIRHHSLVKPDKSSSTRYEPFYQIEEQELNLFLKEHGIE